MHHSQHIYHLCPVQQKNVPPCPEEPLFLDNYLSHLEIAHPLSCDFVSKVRLSEGGSDLHSLFDTSYCFPNSIFCSDAVS